MLIEHLRASEARALGFRPSQERYINRETGETFSKRRGLELTDRPLPGGLSMSRISSTPQGRAIVRDFLSSHSGVTEQSLLNNQSFRDDYRALIRLNGIPHRNKKQAVELMNTLIDIGRVPQKPEWELYVGD